MLHDDYIKTSDAAIRDEMARADARRARGLDAALAGADWRVARAEAARWPEPTTLVERRLLARMDHALRRVHKDGEVDVYDRHGVPDSFVVWWRTNRRHDHGARARVLDTVAGAFADAGLVVVRQEQRLVVSMAAPPSDVGTARCDQIAAIAAALETGDHDRVRAVANAADLDVWGRAHQALARQA